MIIAKTDQYEVSLNKGNVICTLVLSDRAYRNLDYHIKKFFGLLDIV